MNDTLINVERIIGEEFESRILNSWLDTRKQDKYECWGCDLIKICQNDVLRKLMKDLELGECVGKFRKDKEQVIFKIPVLTESCDSGIYNLKKLYDCILRLWFMSDWKTKNDLQEKIFWHWYESFNRRKITGEIIELYKIIQEMEDEDLGRALIVNWLKEKEEQKLKGEL